MDLFKNKNGRFSVYVSGEWKGNVDEPCSEEDVKRFFDELYPNDNVIVWDNED